MFSLTLNLFLDGSQHHADADDGGLHGSDLGRHGRLLSRRAGHRGLRDLLGVGGDLGALWILFHNFDD